MRKAVAPFVLTGAALAGALALRWLLDPVLGDAFPLVTLFGAIAAAVWLAGVRAAVISAVLGYLACHLLFIEPRGAFVFDTAIAVGMWAYAFTCALIIAIGHAMRSAQRRATEGRELLRVTLQSIGDGVITTDASGRVVTMNAVAEELTGWTQAEAAGQPLETIFKIVHEDTRAPAANPAMRAIHEGVIVGLANHTVLVRKDGSERHIDDSAAPIRDEQGRISGCVLIFRDVSSHRHVERAKAGQLQDARVLAAIVESSDDAIISKSLDGVIQSWNAAAERLFGFPAAQAIGRHISLVIPTERLPEEDEIIAKLKAGERIDHVETERMHADGHRLLVSLTISPIRDDAGIVVGASKIARDVGRLRAAEARERVLLEETGAANAKARIFFEQGAVLATIVDIDGTVRDANRLSLEGCGYTREQVVGRKFWEGPWFVTSAALVEQVRTACAQAARGQTYHGELPYFIADGTQRTADVTIQPIIDASGRVLFLAPTGIDITERKRAEADRERLEDNLRRLAADLSDAGRRKDEFLAMLAHELRNPLAPLSNAVQVLQLNATDQRAVASATAMLQRQVGQMTRLVDDLLDVNRITQGRIELRKQHIELAPVVHQAVEATRAMYESMGHDLTVTLPPEPLTLYADPTRLAQILGNLLNNACKFTDRNGRIRVTAHREGMQVVIAVEDSGIGIAARDLAGIFELFTQVDTSLERSRDGLGIGLTLVKTLVEMHDGTVEASSDGPGKGSRFVVRLPLAIHVPDAPVSPATNGERPMNARRVLIVDDNADGANSLAMLIQLAGHEAFVAHDGEAALRDADRLRPDVVLLDIGLPRLNGYEVCKQLRETPWGGAMHVVAVTGWGQDSDRQRSQSAGFDAHLVKPVNAEDLMKLLANA